MFDITPQIVKTLTNANAIGLAWEAVDPDALAVVLRAMPSRLRNRMLSAARVPSSKIGNATSQLLKVNMRRRDESQRFRVARTITHPYADRVVASADDAIGAGADPMVALVSAAEELAAEAGPSIVALTVVSYAYSDPIYHVPALVACGRAHLFGERLVALANDLETAAAACVETLKETALAAASAGIGEAGGETSDDGMASRSSAPPTASALTHRWENAIEASERLRDRMRAGRPAVPDDLAAVSDFTNALWKAAGDVGIADEPSLGAVEAQRRIRSVLAGLEHLSGPEYLTAQLDELRDAIGGAGGELASRLERFVALVSTTDPHKQFAIAGELRQLPAPPAHELLDAALAGLLEIALPDEPGSATSGTPAEPVPPSAMPDGTAEVTSAVGVEVPAGAEEPVQGEPPGPDGGTEGGTGEEEPTVMLPAQPGVAVDLGEAVAEEAGTTGSSGQAAAAVVAPEAGEVEQPGPAAAVGPELDVADDDASLHTEVVQAICELVRAGRFGLGAHLALAEGHEYHARVLEEAALAHAVRNPGSAAASETVHLTETVPLVTADLGSSALRTASALRVALLDPGSGAPVALQRLVPTLGALPALSELAAAVAGPTSQMLSVAAAGVELDAAAAIAECEAIAGWARDALSRPPHQNRLYRGLEIWKAWAAAEGPLGRILALVAANDPERVDDVIALVAPFGRRQLIEMAVDAADASLRRGRAGAASRITGPAKAQLVRHVDEVVRQASAWCDAAGRASRDDHVQKLRADLVRVLRPLRARVLAELEGLCGDDWLEAAGRAARASIDATVELLFGRGLAGGELEVETALNRGLAFVVEVELDDGLNPRPTPTLRQLLAAARRSRAEAFAARIDAADFNAAELVLDTVGPGDDFDTDAARRQLGAAEREMLPRVERRYKDLTERFAAARAHGRLEEEQASALHGELLAGRVLDKDRGQRRDLGVLGRELDALEAKLDVAVRARRTAVRDEISATIAEGSISEAWAERIRRLLDQDELGAAEEYLHRAVAGEPSPPADVPEVTVDLGVAIDTLLQPELGLSPGTVSAIHASSRWGDLDFSALGDLERDAIAGAVDAWILLRTGPPPANLSPVLSPVLRLLGIVPTAVAWPGSLRKLSTKGRVFCDVTGKRSGYAFVPTFGSRSDGRRRFMLCWEQLSPRQLWDTALSSAGPDEPVYVLYMRLLSAEGRAALAREAMSRATGGVVVIDDAVIAACAAAGQQSYDVTMRAVLPYAAPNPYNPDLVAETPEEMFYGRREERDKLASLSGSAFISGGRRLGKTALLHSVRQYLAGTDVLALLVVIQQVAAATRNPDELWPVLGARLAEAGVLSGPPPYNAELVTAGIRRWLAENADRKLLVLLDECDFFLRADAEKNFTNVVALRNLMMEPGTRFKVVFSGLQHVARYLRLPNQPLSHLPQPLMIGPLDPSSASALVRRPLHALGFDVTESQVDRVVTFCACNPSVIQLTCMELVDRMQRQQRQATTLAPWPVEESVLDALFDSPELAGGVKDRLFLTLNLDHRYKLLAYLVAYQAVLKGLGAAASPVELRAQALEYWPDGFSTQDADDVRALCDELVGLGVFAGDADVGYRMLSPATVRLFGTEDEIGDQLASAFETYNPDLSAGAAGTRTRLDDARFSPLTAGQMADAIAVGKTQLRVVFGSRAMCRDSVIDALRAGASELGADFVETTHLRSWRDKMALPRGGHAVVVTDMATRSQESFEDSVAAARRRTSRRTNRGSRAAVLVVGPAESWLLDNLGVSAEPTAAGVGDLANLAITLRRVDAKALAASVRIGELDLGLPAQQRRLLEVTGGWPMFVERAVNEIHTRPFDAIADDLDTYLSTLAGSEELVAAVGLDPKDPGQPGDPDAVAVLSALVTNDWATAPGAAAARTTLIEFLVELGDIDASVASRGLGVLELLDALEYQEDGALYLEPVLVGCVRRCLVAAPGNSIHSS